MWEERVCIYGTPGVPNNFPWEGSVRIYGMLGVLNNYPY